MFDMEEDGKWKENRLMFRPHPNQMDSFNCGPLVLKVFNC